MYQIKILEDQLQQINQRQQVPNNIETNKSIDELSGEIGKLFENKKQELNNTIVKIFVIGAINSGKSTLINTILGMPLLATSYQTDTKNFITIKNHNDQWISIIDDDLEIYLDSPLNFRRCIEQIQKVYCQFPEQLRFSNIEFIETPGFQYDNQEYNQTIIRQLVEQTKSEGIIPFFILVVKNCFIETEYQLMRMIIKQIIEMKENNITGSMKQLLQEIDQNNVQNQIPSRNNFIVINTDHVQQQNNFETFINGEGYQQCIFRVPAQSAFYKHVFSNKNTNFYAQLLDEYYAQYQGPYNLQNRNQAEEFIAQNYLNNKQELIYQDFTYFINQLQTDIIYEFNKMHYNLTHFQLQSQLCKLDQMKQNQKPEKNQQFIRSIYQFFEQANQRKDKIITQDYLTYQKEFINSRKEYYNQFVQNVQHSDKHQLMKKIYEYQLNTAKELNRHQEQFKDLYSQFIVQFKKQFQSLIGVTELSFEKCSFCDLNSYEQCELIIYNIENGLLNLQQQNEILQISFENQVGVTQNESNFLHTISSLVAMFKKITFRKNNIFETLKSTFNQIQNDQVVDLRIIKGNLYFVERQMVKCILDYKDNLSMSLIKIMEGLDIFLHDIY